MFHIALSTFPRIISSNPYKYNHPHLINEKTGTEGFFQGHLGREGVRKIKNTAPLGFHQKTASTSCICWNIKQTYWFLKLFNAINLDVCI